MHAVGVGVRAGEVGVVLLLGSLVDLVNRLGLGRSSKEERKQEEQVKKEYSQVRMGFPTAMRYAHGW